MLWPFFMKKPSDCKDYLKAKTPEGLKVLMIKNNLKTNSYHDYRIIHDGSFWYAWYEFDASSIIDKETKRVMSEGLDQR